MANLLQLFLPNHNFWDCWDDRWLQTKAGMMLLLLRMMWCQLKDLWLLPLTFCHQCHIISQCVLDQARCQRWIENVCWWWLGHNIAVATMAHGMRAIEKEHVKDGIGAGTGMMMVMVGGSIWFSKKRVVINGIVEKLPMTIAGGGCMWQQTGGGWKRCYCIGWHYCICGEGAVKVEGDVVGWETWEFLWPELELARELARYLHKEASLVSVVSVILLLLQWPSPALASSCFKVSYCILSPTLSFATTQLQGAQKALSTQLTEILLWWWCTMPCVTAKRWCIGGGCLSMGKVRHWGDYGHVAISALVMPDCCQPAIRKITQMTLLLQYFFVLQCSHQ